MYGLVLEGGGAKGAYQIGSYFALKELKFEFKAVVGTSIGALNGALIVMGEPDKCAKMWKTLSFEKFPSSDSELSTLDEIEKFHIKEPGDIIEFAKLKVSGFIKNKQIPVEPLKKLVNDYIDEDKLRASGIDYGLVTLNVSDKKGEELFLSDIPYGKLKNYIIASAYFPLFTLEPLDGKFYLDGGLYNNLPYEMVLKKGLTPVIVRTNPNDLMDTFPDNSIVIAPKKKYTSAMDFNPLKAEEIMRIGYFDTYKAVKKLLGDKYYIKPFTEKEAYYAIEEIFLNKLDDINVDYFKNNSKFRDIFEEIIPQIGSELGLNSKFSYVDFLVKFLEREAESMNLDYLKVYNLEQLVKEVKKKNLALNENNPKNKKINELVKKILDKNED